MVVLLVVQLADVQVVDLVELWAFALVVWTASFSVCSLVAYLVASLAALTVDD